MPLITPKTDWIAGDSVGFSDMNRIEGNILYLQNEDKTINGTNTYTGASTFNSSLEVIGLTTISSSGITSSSASINLLKPFSDIADSTGTIALFQNTNANGFGALFNTTVNTTGSEYIIEARASSTTRFKVMANGRSIFGGVTDNEEDLVQMGDNLDISIVAGRGRMGYAGGTTDQFTIAHRDNFNTTDFALRATTGGTQTNAKLGSAFSILNAGTDILAVFSASLVELKKPVEALSGIKTDNVTLKTKVLEIGTWNMSSGGGGSTTKSVVHGLTRSKIRKVKVVIVNDSATITYPLEYVPFNELSSTTAIPEGSLNATATNIAMRIRSGGWWNAGTNLEFDGTQNRGYIEIDYEA